MIELRCRSVVAPADIEAMRGKIVTSSAYDVMLTGPARVMKPNGAPLCVYLPGVLAEPMTAAWGVLHSLRNERTDNRGDASGTERMKRGDQKRTRASLVPSAIIGAVDPGGIYPFCRLTSWTGRHPDEWASLGPLLRSIDAQLAEHVPDRWAAQRAEADRCHPEWIVPGTTFSTITVNNTYSTGVHADMGDFGAGFSTLAVARRGSFTGGELVFARYRVAVDMHHGDLLLLDAHEPHGNTAIAMVPASVDPGERISLVSYLRAGMSACGTAEHELAKAHAAADARTSRHSV